MAISIKNHEDRITALENPVRIWVKLSDVVRIGTSWTEIFRTPIQSGIAIAWLTHGYSGESTEERYRHCALIPLGHHFSWLGYEVENTASGELICLQLDNTSIPGYTRLLARTEGNVELNDNVVISSWFLKLYYNFSYNITREFYKVKFKLKHYLCSHLQKFI